MLLPSQAIKAIDRQRQDLVAYEYLCHLAEYVPPVRGRQAYFALTDGATRLDVHRARTWIETHITTRADPTVPLWDSESIADFEKSLRNGYALAHLARSLGGPSCQGPIYNVSFRNREHVPLAGGL